MNITDELRQLRERDPDLALILDTFATIDQIYHQSLVAMGQENEDIPLVRNSTEVTFFVDASTSTANRVIRSESK